MEHDQVRKLKRQFKGIWIPAVIVTRPELSALEKMLWADIDSFSGADSTWFKSRKRAAADMCVSEVTISRALKVLRESDLIVMVKNDGRVVHYVTTLTTQIDESGESDVSSQTDQIDDIDNNIVKQKRTQNRVCTLDEAKEYMSHLGFGGEADKFYDYYTANGWTQGRGKAIKDWKAAARNWTRNAKQYTKKERGFNPNNFTADGLGSFITDG
jgi:DNA-binding transcriptional regulator YhcF (GntR family)